MIRIVHVSDLHFGKSERQNHQAGELLYLIKRKFGFRLGEDTYLMVTGDTTNDGGENQYSLAHQALIPFMGNLLIVPGNHDYGPVGNLYSRAAATEFDEFARSLGVYHRYINNEPHVRVLRDEATKVLTVGLNSVKQTPTFTDWARGRIGSAQLASLSNILDDPGYAGMKKIVYLHHRPHRGDKYFEVMELEDRERLMDVLRGRTDVLAFGHEGAMQIETKSALKSMAPLATGSMNVGNSIGGCLFLDADDSVALQRCYVIDFDGSNGFTARMDDPTQP